MLDSSNINVLGPLLQAGSSSPTPLEADLGPGDEGDEQSQRVILAGEDTVDGPHGVLSRLSGAEVVAEAVRRAVPCGSAASWDSQSSQLSEHISAGMCRISSGRLVAHWRSSQATTEEQRLQRADQLFGF